MSQNKVVQKIFEHDTKIKRLSNTQTAMDKKLDSVTEGKCIVQYSEKWGFGSKCTIRIPGTDLVNENAYCPEGVLSPGVECSYKVVNGEIVLTFAGQQYTTQGIPVHGHSSSTDGGVLTYWTGTF